MQPRLRRHLALLLTLSTLAAYRTHPVSAAPSPQEPEPEAGTLELTNPQGGDTVRGVVQIVGTALHPDFNNYVVEFGFDPNPDDQWFPVQPPVAQQVQSGPLAIWDTTVVADGPYQLRLRVALNDGGSEEIIVTGITVSNAVPTVLPTVAPTITASPTSSFPTPGPSPTPLIGQPPTRTPRPTATPGGPTLTPTPNPNVALNRLEIRRSACRGAVITGIIFAALGVYSLLRRYARVEIRRWWLDFRREVLQRRNDNT